MCLYTARSQVGLYATDEARLHHILYNIKEWVFLLFIRWFFQKFFVSVIGLLSCKNAITKTLYKIVFTCYLLFLYLCNDARFLKKQ